MGNDKTKNTLFPTDDQKISNLEKQFSAYLLIKNIQVNHDDFTEERRAVNKVNLYQVLIMHLDYSTASWQTTVSKYGHI